MKKALHILVLSLMLLPASVRATTFEPPDRDLTPEEKKVGSMYRGCNGFHCLEEDPELAVAMEVSETPCDEGADFRTGVIVGEGYACLSVETNAREGVIVVMEAEPSVRACPEEARGGMKAKGALTEGCADIGAQAPVMGTDDFTDGAFGSLKLEGVPEGSRVRLRSFIAY